MKPALQGYLEACLTNTAFALVVWGMKSSGVTTRYLATQSRNLLRCPFEGFEVGGKFLDSEVHIQRLLVLLPRMESGSEKRI